LVVGYTSPQTRGKPGYVADRCGRLATLGEVSDGPYEIPVPDQLVHVRTMSVAPFVT